MEKRGRDGRENLGGWERGEGQFLPSWERKRRGRVDESSRERCFELYIHVPLEVVHILLVEEVVS